MKFIISKNTVKSINAEAFVALAPAIMEFDPTIDGLNFALALAFSNVELDDTHANHSVTESDDDFILEINDEVLFKYMRVYAKIAQVVAPFIKPLMSFARTISGDLNDIQRFTNQKK